jgi:hypothetical protein
MDVNLHAWDPYSDGYMGPPWFSRRTRGASLSTSFVDVLWLKQENPSWVVVRIKKNRHNPTLPLRTSFHFLQTWLHCPSSTKSMCMGDGVGEPLLVIVILTATRKGLKKQMGFHWRTCTDWDRAPSLLDMHHDPCAMDCLTC